MKNRFFNCLMIIALLSVTQMVLAMDVSIASKRKTRQRSQSLPLAFKQSTIKSSLKNSIQICSEAISSLAKKEKRLLGELDKVQVVISDLHKKYTCEDICNQEVLTTYQKKDDLMTNALRLGVKQLHFALEQNASLRALVSLVSHNGLISTNSVDQQRCEASIQDFSNLLENVDQRIKKANATLEEMKKEETTQYTAGRLKAQNDHLMIMKGHKCSTVLMQNKELEKLVSLLESVEKPKTFWTGKKTALISTFFLFMVAAYACYKNQIMLPDFLKAFKFT